jgi:hypothetical protein
VDSQESHAATKTPIPGIAPSYPLKILCPPLSLSISRLVASRGKKKHRWEGAAMAKNYHAILGVSPTATFEEIRSAYRQRAKHYHPDYFGKNSAPFLGVQEAWDG